MNETNATRAEQLEAERSDMDDQFLDEEHQHDIGIAAVEDADIVDWASDNSFPASDPPPWTPGIA